MQKEGDDAAREEYSKWEVYLHNRPEHQQLQDARQRAAQLARGITASQLDPLAASIDDLLA